MGGEGGGRQRQARWCPSEVADKVKALKCEVRELRQANEILREASTYFARAELDRPFRR
jgi:transposase